ncbi:MAG: hypothetical protein WA790_18515 [Sulfitobacter sp.]
MTPDRPIVLILGSGPNVTAATLWPNAWFDHIVAMNNAWRVRPDWNALVYPEDFPAGRLPQNLDDVQMLVKASEFVPAQNKFGGFVHAGATMAFTTAYWALAALRPKVMAFMGCDMVYPSDGPTHFYGTGTPDPLRKDITLSDLGAKSARLAIIAAEQDCACVNLSKDASALLFPRAEPDQLRKRFVNLDLDHARYKALRNKEEALGYHTPTGRYTQYEGVVDMDAMADIDRRWRALFSQHFPG